VARPLLGPHRVRATEMRSLRDLPKGHLHLHLDGAMRPDTLRELAAGAGLAVPDITTYGSFAAFSDTMDLAQRVLRTEADLTRLVRETVEDAALDGVIWLELSMWPGMTRGKFGGDERIVELVLEAALGAAGDRGIDVGLMIAANRNRDPDAAEELARLAVRFAGDGVVSFGLDGDEAVNPPDPFGRAFRIAKDAGLLATPHAGELAGPESVAAALDVLGADRILHGVRAIEDPALVARIAREEITLDVCPTSNVMLGVVRRTQDHPLLELLAAGVRCSVNADDPLLFGTGILPEYSLCRELLGLGDEELAAVARCSLTASAAPPDLIERGLVGVSEWLDRGS
jgi:adenosine deaminase